MQCWESFATYRGFRCDEVYFLGYCNSLRKPEFYAAGQIHRAPTLSQIFASELIHTLVHFLCLGNITDQMDVQVHEDTGYLPTPATSPKPSRLPFHSNPDILDEVCEYLAYDHDSPADEVLTSKGNLLNLALTCKAFIEPALDRLWRSLDCLFPLLKILPAFSQSDGTYVCFLKFQGSTVLIFFCCRS